MPATIEIAAGATDELVAAVGVLLPQLSSSAAVPTADELAKLVGNPDTPMFLARLDGRIVGMLTLVLFRIPTGLKAWIEDVVVDSSARGHGVAQALSRAALAHARDSGAKAVSLTSRPARQAANQLYVGLGFYQRDTNVYRYDL